MGKIGRQKDGKKIDTLFLSSSHFVLKHFFSQEIKIFMWVFLTHTFFYKKLFCEELQTYRALFILICCFTLYKTLIFRKTWLYVQREKSWKYTSEIIPILSVVWLQLMEWTEIGHRFVYLNSTGAVSPVLSSRVTCPPGTYQGCAGAHSNYFKLAQVNLHKLCCTPNFRKFSS